MEGTNGDHNMIDCSDDDERENRSVRSVVRVAQETKASVDAMLRSTANETPDCEVKKESRLSDWTVLRAQMEALCGDVMGGPRKGISGAVLLSPLEKGHLMFKCSDGCFDDAKLRDIPNCSFPGAVAREPITTLWDAWLATSIFQRTDISLGEKIKLHREGAACYEASALKNVLKMAFDKCIDWTDFITNTRRIRQHGSIQGHHFESSYDEALQTVRKELTEDAIRSRPQKKGPIGFMAGEGALPLEKDGQGGDVVTKMVTTFDRLMELLEEWSTFRTWVMVWPLDARMDEDKMKRLLKITREHLQNGGKVVTIWPPINERNSAKWRELAELWSTLDNALERIDDGNQVFRTASSVTVDGRLYIEAGSPEGSGQFFTSHIGTGVPKYVYEAARKKAVGAMLPPLPDCRFVTSRAMSTEGAGMLGSGSRPPLKRRALQ